MHCDLFSQSAASNQKWKETSFPSPSPIHIHPFRTIPQKCHQAFLTVSLDAPCISISPFGHLWLLFFFKFWALFIIWRWVFLSFYKLVFHYYVRLSFCHVLCTKSEIFEGSVIVGWRLSYIYFIAAAFHLVECMTFLATRSFTIPVAVETKTELTFPPSFPAIVTHSKTQSLYFASLRLSDFLTLARYHGIYVCVCTYI